MDATKSLTIVDTTTSLVPPGAGKDARYRLGKFQAWMTAQGRVWHKPDLTAYRDHLLATLAPATVSGHLSTIRARYRVVLRDDATRDNLYNLAQETLCATDQADTPANRKAFVDELITRIENAIDPKAAPVKVTTSQDRPDADHLRLTAKQAAALLASPGVDTLAGLRNTAIIALMLCTGIREAELSALEMRDLRQELGGELALHVRLGKGAKERLVPYGDLQWALVIVDAWTNAAGIEDGPVFRGLHKGGKTLRPGRLSVRAIEYIVKRYPVVVTGRLATARPHDLRRTYARRMYEAGVAPMAIQQNLGHSDLKTTLGYIGTLDVNRRKPPVLYSFNLGDLFRQGELALGL
jgi:site-specific recombinase XerD